MSLNVLIANITIRWIVLTMLQTQILSIGQVDEPCIGLTQENLIENSIQDSLSYILKPHSLC